MPIVTINRNAGYHYTPLGRALTVGDNEVTNKELAMLWQNEQIVREAEHGILELPPLEPTKKTKGGRKAKAEPEPEVRTEVVDDLGLIDDETPDASHTD